MVNNATLSIFLFLFMLKDEIGQRHCCLCDIPLVNDGDVCWSGYEICETTSSSSSVVTIARKLHIMRYLKEAATCFLSTLKYTLYFSCPGTSPHQKAWCHVILFHCPFRFHFQFRPTCLRSYGSDRRTHPVSLLRC